jgi:hypothetical protein
MRRILAVNIMLAIALLVAAAPRPASAHDRVDVCAKYMDTGAAYHLLVDSFNGIDLNVATSSFRYHPFRAYVVIIWQKGEASLIELDATSLTDVPVPGHDQYGRTWEVGRYVGFCHDALVPPR